MIALAGITRLDIRVTIRGSVVLPQAAETELEFLSTLDRRLCCGVLGTLIEEIQVTAEDALPLWASRSSLPLLLHRHGRLLGGGRFCKAAVFFPLRLR